MISPDAKAFELIAGEIAVLRVLEDRRWRTSPEIVDDSELLPLAIGSVLREVADRGLVRRSITGHWQTTASGRVEAARQRVAR